MYEELIRVLRHCGNPNVSCEGCFDEDDCIGTDGAWEIGAMANMRSAADAIEQLSKPRWIPVTEMLPNGIAIAVNALRGSYGYHEYLIGYIGENEESDSGYSCESEGEILMNVTHWMPLPSTEGLNET